MPPLPPALHFRPKSEIHAATALRAILDAESYWPREVLANPYLVLETTTCPLLFLSGPDHIKAALQQSLGCLPRSRLERRFAGKSTGRNSVISGRSERSPIHRQALSRLFRAQRLPDYFPFVQATIRNAIEPWFQAADAGVAIDAGRAAVHATFGVVWQIMLGETGRPVPPAPVFDMAESLFAAGVSGHLPATSAAINKAAQASLALRPERPLAADTPFARVPPPGLALTPEEVDGNIRFLMVAGHESTALTITWALLMLAMHPEIQAAVAQEVRAEAGEGPLDLAALRRMVRLERVLDETMRLYPAGHVILREAASDLVLADLPVPSGSQIAICFYGLHRHQTCWERPDHFEPDRFEPAQVRRRHPAAFMPFAAGPQSCLGGHLVWLEAMLVLASTLRELDVVLAGDLVKPVASYSLRPDRPVMLRFTRRPGSLGPGV